MNSIEVRTELFHRLRRDLVGPAAHAPDGYNDSDLAEERLRDNPSRWYLTGFIAPSDESDEIEVEARLSADTYVRLGGSSVLG